MKKPNIFPLAAAFRLSARAFPKNRRKTPLWVNVSLKIREKTGFSQKNALFYSETLS